MPSYDGSTSSTKSVAPSFTATFQDNNESAVESTLDKEAEKSKVCINLYVYILMIILPIN